MADVFISYSRKNSALARRLMRRWKNGWRDQAQLLQQALWQSEFFHGVFSLANGSQQREPNFFAGLRESGG